MPWLVIGYGNTLRSDDAVGPTAVEELDRLHLPGVHTLSYPLLTPEAAEPVSRAREVIFIDAATGNGHDVQLRVLKPAHSSQVMAHAARPETISRIGPGRIWALSTRLPACHPGRGPFSG